MGRYSGKTCRLVFLLVITALFFVAEIVVGYAGNSVALVSDSFSMLSDAASLSVGLLSARLSRRRGTKRCSFGLARLEVVGALSNAVFLTALLFSISAEAIKRLTRPEPIDEPFLVLVVGALGLAVNVLGLMLFQRCRWACGRAPSAGAAEDGEEKTARNGAAGPTRVQPDESRKNDKESDEPPLNIRGVLLHVLNDALGSVVVVVASVLFYVWPLSPDTPCNWQCYVDPGLTLVMVAIILSSAVPLMRETTGILLQMSPADLPVSTVLEDVCRLPGVVGVHEVHVWELVKDRNVATLHVTVNPESGDPPFKTLHGQIREVFHKAGVHSVTVQLEVCDDDQTGGQCSNPCMSSECLKLSCCPTDPKSASGAPAHEVNQPSGEVSVDMVDGTKHLLGEPDTNHVERKPSDITKF